MEKEYYTLEELSKVIENIKNMGGDLKEYTFVVGGRKVFDDEVGINCMTKEFEFRGYLYHEDISKKTLELQKDIKKAVDKFYK